MGSAHRRACCHAQVFAPIRLMTGGAVTLRRPGLSRDINGPGGGGGSRCSVDMYVHSLEAPVAANSVRRQTGEQGKEMASVANKPVVGTGLGTYGLGLSSQLTRQRHAVRLYQWQVSLSCRYLAGGSRTIGKHLWDQQRIRQMAWPSV